jgi:hypothetical protein
VWTSVSSQALSTGSQASGYGSDGYLEYCGVTSHGDYDHSAIWFSLEPAAGGATSNAQVLFLVIAVLSSQVIADWFSLLSVSY